MAAAILQLEADGQVSLDKSICAYIADCPSQWNNIHVFHLLTHSSGLPGLTGTQQCVDHSSPLADSQAVSLLSKDPVMFKPGSRFSRSNSDYLLLSLLIERVSGQPTRDYLAQHIFAPLKMTHTSYDFGYLARTCRGRSKIRTLPPRSIASKHDPISCQLKNIFYDQ